MAAHAGAVGADAFLKKPFEAQTLLSTIEALLEGPLSGLPGEKAL
jgi:hypothetical protein